MSWHTDFLNIFCMVLMIFNHSPIFFFCVFIRVQTYIPSGFPEFSAVVLGFLWFSLWFSIVFCGFPPLSEFSNSSHGLLWFSVGFPWFSTVLFFHGFPFVF